MTTTSNKGVMVVQETAVNVSNPKQLAEFATTLKAFIVKEKLFTEIKGKNFVEVEGWQFAGAAMGILPVVVETTDLSADGEIKYKAVVELRRLSDNSLVGSGSAVCSNKEAKKRTFDDYAVLSMAQTRAVGKAYRLGFGWLMKMAGYQATPAEEATYTNTDSQEQEYTEPIVTDPLPEVEARVNQRLDKMSTADRLRALKLVGKVTTKGMSEVQWRRLDEETKDEIQSS